MRTYYITMFISNTWEKYLFLHSFVLIQGEFRVFWQLLLLSVFFFCGLLYLSRNFPGISAQGKEEGNPMNGHNISSKKI